VLELSDLVQQARDDVLRKFVILLLLAEPGEVLVLELKFVQLLVEAVEGPRIALLVDEALSLLQCLRQLLFLGAKALDMLDLLLLLEASGFLLANSLLLFLAPCFDYLSLTLFDLGLEFLELATLLFGHGVFMILCTLLILVENLLNELIIAHCFRAAFLKFLFLVTTGFLLEQLAFQVSKLV